MATIQKRISTLVNQQLPEFISGEYPKFASFLQKYYEQLELTGQPLDIIQNLTKYNDIDTYEKDILSEFTILTSNVSATASTIQVTDTYAFPETNGYVMIDDEIIFYASKTSTSFLNCKRNLSGTTKLGDLYNASVYKTVASHDFTTGFQHIGGEQAFNISNLFLYAFVKNYESEYLASFPEESLKPEVDKRTLIKNIKQFYRAKGTDQSIEFIFNSIVAQDSSDIPSIYYPRDNTLKTSTSNWINKYALKVKIISQIDPNDTPLLIGQKLIQEEDVYNSKVKNNFGIIDNVIFVGNYDGESIYEIVISPNSVVGEFQVAQKSFLTKRLLPNDTNNNRINVFSTTGWKNTKGKLLIGTEIFTFKDKTVNQFEIETRGGNGDYPINTPVYNYASLSTVAIINGVAQKIKFLALGVLYNISVSSGMPFSSEGDLVQISDSGFETRNPIIYDKTLSSIRWKLNDSVSTSNISGLNNVLTDVAAIYEDAQYYYIASSGYPSYSIGNFANISLKDQKHLKLIKKQPTRTTEIYKSNTRDVGVFLNGVVAYGYKDYDTIYDSNNNIIDNDIIYGGVVSVNVINKGKGYLAPPYVLISGDKGAIAKAILSGEVIDRIEIISSGEKYESNPQITITSGRGAQVSAVVTLDKVTKLVIDNPGEYYSSPPTIIISDAINRGKLAEYTAVISTDGKLIDTIKISEGKFYSQENIKIFVVSAGTDATANALVKKWKINRFEKLKNVLDSNYGYYFENIERSFANGYAHLGSPVALRNQLGDTTSNRHSPILGYAYDGNPIYGPYAYSNPLDPSSNIKRMETSYRLKTDRINGPSISAYSLGYFIDDYRYQHRFGDLDNNNGRYCITPDYPNGVYAYFITINQSNIPVFPYIIGDTYYAIPVESNYTNKIQHTNLPANAKRLRTALMPKNGVNAQTIIETTKEGNVTSSIIESSNNIFSVGSSIIVDNSNTSGSQVSAEVSSIKGKNIVSIESNQTKAILIESKNPVYFFNQSIITQEGTNASGEVVGDIFSSNNFVLRNTSGIFNAVSKLNSNITVLNLILDTESFFTKNATIKFTNGKEVTVISIQSGFLKVAFNPFINGDAIVFPQTINGILANTIYYVTNSSSNQFKISATQTGAPLSLQDFSSFGVVASSEIARGEILETVSGGNTVRVKVTDGNFIVSPLYYLKTSKIDDTVGSRVFKIDELSKNVEINSINQQIALVNTNSEHKLTENDSVIIDINPNDATTTTTYYVRKRIYQTVKLVAPSSTTFISDNGIGVTKRLNGGNDYANAGSAAYSNIELIFADQSRLRNRNGIIVSSNAFIGSVGAPGNARANITVTNGVVSENGVSIVGKGSGYQIGDILTVSNTDLQRLSGSLSQSFLYLEVTHVGLGKTQTKLIVDSVFGISNGDVLKINNELILVNSILNNVITVTRGIQNTIATNHFTNSPVFLNDARYNFIIGNRIGTSSGDAIINYYDSQTQELTVIFDINQNLESINELTFTTNFFDTSSPAKVVKIDSVVKKANFKFEFSKFNSTGPWIKNPIIDIQQYYNYKFITNNSSLSGSFLEFSPSNNKNIITTEVIRGSFLPGSGSEFNSFISVKFGFGDASPLNNYTQKKNLDFSNYFYYDKAGIIDSENSYLSVVNDPLQGEKIVSYVSPNSFAYNLDRLPEYDATGTYNYTTTSISAIGVINNLRITNTGKLYKKLPTIYGAQVSPIFECIPNVNFDSETGKILSVSVNISGSGYSKPAAFLLNEINSPEFKIVKGVGGKIVAILIKDNEITFSKKPIMFIIETDIVGYLGSNNIGIPKNIKIDYNGSNYYDDYSLLPDYKSHQILQISNFIENCFLNGEIVKQFENNSLIAEGRIAADGYRNKINILKLTDVKGEFKQNLLIIGQSKKNTALISNVFYSVLSPEIKSYYDNAGYYDTDSGKLSTADQKLTDAYFYQDYSYVVKSKSPINIWKKLVEQTVHPSGFKMFGEVLINATASTQMPEKQKILSNVSILQLWDEKSNRATIESTRYQTTQTVVCVKDTNVRRGKGSVFASSIDTSETLAYTFTLQQAFNGDFNQSGNRVGTKTFNMIVPGLGPLNVNNINNLIITLDGILQEPNKSFTISGSSITFAQAPLGNRTANNQNIEAQKFIGRIVRFKNDSFNAQYFKKIKNIESNFDSILTRFPLYYEDGTNAILDAKENLIVSIDGVLQENKMTPLIPATSSYYIDRSKTPNEIVFVAPPTKLNNDNYQKFFAYSVGNYERLEIDEKLFTGKRKGPFVLRSVLGKRTINIDSDRNILLFREGILQLRNRDYIITGANIIFSEALVVGQKINILYLYGRETTPKLTFHNFEDNKFFNTIKIVVNQNISPKDLFGKNTIYQGNSISSWECVGEIMSFKPSNNITIFTIRQQNSLFQNNKDLKIIGNGSEIVIPFNNIISISEFEENDEKNDLVYRYKSNFSNLNSGDLIKIDGERDYRSILEIPEFANKRGHRPQDLIENNHYGLINVTQYNGIIDGVGLNVVANISNGKISSLIWNNRKYEEYATRIFDGIIIANPIYSRNGFVELTTPNLIRLRNNTTLNVINDNAATVNYNEISIQPNAFGYKETPQLVFVPQPQRDAYGNITGPVVGGGASGFVVMDKGEIIDVILSSVGSGYLTPPKVYVTRGYDIYKLPENLIRSTTDFTLSPKITFDTTITRVITVIQSPFILPEIQTISEVRCKYDSIIPTKIITPKSDAVTIEKINHNIISIITLEAPEVISITNISYSKLSIFVIPPVVTSIISLVKTSINIIEFGSIDTYQTKLNNSQYNFDKLGNKFEVYENIKFLTDFGAGNINQQNTLEMIDTYYPTITLGDFSDGHASSTGINGGVWDLTYPPIYEYGAYLDISLSVASVGGYDNISGFLGQNNLVLISGAYTITVNVALDGIVTLISVSLGAPSGLYITPGGTRFIYNLADTIIYIPNTSRFSSTGKLLIGNEIVTYTGKLSDRFIGVTRGAENTTIQEHSPGDYLRSLL